MSQEEFRRFSGFIYDQCGIKMPPAKKTMLTGRLLKRLRVLGLSSYSEYYDYVCSREGAANELAHMIDAVTTNKTEFFREAAHFDYLVDHALPTLLTAGRSSARRKILVWSAGCSSGEEPYTLAMVLDEFFSSRKDGDFHVLATDISTRVLETARRGIYPEGAVDSVSQNQKKKYLMRGKGSQKGYCRVVPELRRKISFQRLNFMDSDFKLRQPADVIFCRNVIIYFDRPTQSELFKKFYACCSSGGYLFIGHSETLHGISELFTPAGTSVYRKPS